MVSSDDCSLSTAFGSCVNHHCQSTCVKTEAEVEVVSAPILAAIETIAEAKIQQLVTSDLQPILVKLMGNYMAGLVESGVVQLADHVISPQPTSTSTSSPPPSASAPVKVEPHTNSV